MTPEFSFYLIPIKQNLSIKNYKNALKVWFLNHNLHDVILIRFQNIQTFIFSVITLCIGFIIYENAAIEKYAFLFVLNAHFLQT